MLSNETQLLEECKAQKTRFYTYMLPILDKYASSVDRTLSSAVYITNTELVDKKCRSEAKNNRLQLRTN